MTRDEIIDKDEVLKIARQHFCRVEYDNGNVHECYEFSLEELESFAKLVADVATAKEREACANLVENLLPVGVYRQLERATFKDAAVAIRARGEA